MLVDRLYYELDIDTRASEQGLGRMNTSFNNILGTIAKWAGLAAAIYAVGRAVQSAKRDFIDYEHGMREIWTLVDTGEGYLRSYMSELMRISTIVPQSIGVLEKAMYQAISSNVDMADSIYVVEESSKAAVAGLTDVATAVDIGTTIMNAYGLTVRDVTDINDVLFTGVRLGKTTYDELASTLGAIIPTAATLGVELDVLVSAVAAMTRGGIDTTNAVTYLNQVLVSILNPTKQAREEAAKYGIELSQTALHTQGLLPFLENLKEQVGDNGEAMATMFGNVRALRGVLSLTGAQMSDFNEIMGEMGDRAGATEDAYGKMIDSTRNKLEALSSTWSVVGILIWEKINPAFNAMIDVLNWLGRGLVRFLDDGYKLRDMFADLDREAIGLADSINEVAREVESANSIVQMYSSELERARNDADDFQSSIKELTDLVYEHNWAVSTGEGDYHRLREAIEKLIQKNPDLIGMYEMEGEMLKLNIELIKAQTEARIAELESQKAQLEYQAEVQRYEVEALERRYDALVESHARFAEELEDIQPIRDALRQLGTEYDEIIELTDETFVERMQQQKNALISFFDEYGERLVERNALTQRELDRLVSMLEGAHRDAAGIAVIEAMEVFSPEFISNFEDEFQKLNTTLSQGQRELDEIEQGMYRFQLGVDAAEKSVKATDIAIRSMTEISETIGTGMEDYWRDWLESERAVFDRFMSDYKELRDSQHEYDQQMAERSLSSAKSTLTKIRLYAIRMKDEEITDWTRLELNKLAEIEEASKQTYQDIVRSRREYYDKRIEEEKALLSDLEATMGDTADRVLQDQLKRKQEGLARLYIDAFMQTADEIYLQRLQEETSYTVDQVMRVIEGGQSQLQRLYSNLESMEQAYYAVRSQLRDAEEREQTEHIAMYEEFLQRQEASIISMIVNTYRETGDHNVFNLLIEKAEEFGMTTTEVFGQVQAAQKDFSDYEAEQLEKITRLREEYNALLERGVDEEAASKLRQLANANLELWLASVVAGREQAQYFNAYSDALERLNVETEKARTRLDDIADLTDIYLSVIRRDGQEAADAARQIAGNIANAFKDMYYESIEAGKENDQYWQDYITWSRRAQRITEDSKDKVAEYTNEIQQLMKQYDDAVARGTLNVALGLAQNIERVYARLATVSSEFFGEQEQWMREVAELQERIRDEEPRVDPVARLQERLDREKELIEAANEERIRLERELEEERRRIQEEEELEPEEIARHPAMQAIEAELERVLSMVESRERAIASIYQSLWEETKDPAWLQLWINATKQIEEAALSTWDALRSQFEFMVADSRELAQSSIAQWEVLRELVGELPETGRATFVKELFDVDTDEALKILSFIERIEQAAQREIAVAMKEIADADKAQSEARIDAVMDRVRQILSLEHMSYEQQITYLNMALTHFKGTEEEKAIVTERINQEIARLEKRAFEQRKREIEAAAAEESKTRISEAERAITEISRNERASIAQRIAHLNNYLQHYELSAEERIRLEQKVADEISQLQLQLSNELKERAKTIPEEISYKKRLELLEKMLQEELELVGENLEARLRLEEQYYELKEMMRQAEVDRVKTHLDDLIGFFRGFTDEAGAILEDGGRDAGIRLINALFEQAEALSRQYAQQYIVDPILDAVAQATVDAQQQGQNFAQALNTAIGAALSGNILQFAIAAFTWNLSQYKKMFDRTWEGLKSIQWGWLQRMLFDIEWFFGGGKEAIEDMRSTFEEALRTAGSAEEIGENLERTIKERLKRGIIEAFLETAAMQELYEELARMVERAMAGGEVTEEEWEEIERKMKEAAETLEEFYDNLPDWLDETLPDTGRRTDTVRSITEETANILLAIERSSNLYLKEINENIRAMRFIMQHGSPQRLPNLTQDLQGQMRAQGL